MSIYIVSILVVILICLVLLNYASLNDVPSTHQKIPDDNSNSSNFGYYTTRATCSNMPGCCSLTKFGCCPDGLNSRIDYFGSNCPQTYIQ